MSKVDDLRQWVGERVYFNRPFRTLAGTQADSGILESVDDVTCVVRWDSCICLDGHTVDAECSYTERVSIFLIDKRCPLLTSA